MNDFDDYTRKPTKRQGCIVLGIAFTLFVVGLIVISVGGGLIAQKPAHYLAEQNFCKPSAGGSASRLFTFLQQVEDIYYELHPYKLGFKDNIDKEEFQSKYKAYDPSPWNLKNITDASSVLFNHTDSFNVEQLKQREKKLLVQVKIYLKYIFGGNTEGNYYNGDFMIGPDSVFCCSPICDMGKDLNRALKYLKPASVNDARFLRVKLKEFNTSVERYIANLRDGVKAGLLRTNAACKAGVQAFKRRYPWLAHEGQKGIVNETFARPVFAENFTSEFNSSEEEAWARENEKSLSESLRDDMEEYVGKSLVNLMSYLEFNYTRHCVYSNVSSGLASLPLAHVYVDGEKTDEKTTNGALPGSDTTVNITKAYEYALRFYTSFSSTPNEIQELGWNVTNRLYEEITNISKRVTNEDNNNTAKLNFLKLLDDRSKWWYGGAVSLMSSDKNDFKTCVDFKTAEVSCKTRLDTIWRWASEARKVSSIIHNKILDLFHFAGINATTSNCPVEMEIDFDPTATSRSYSPADNTCSQPGKYRIPFWSLKPLWQEWGEISQKARPGYHTQMMGYLQNFEDNCGTPLQAQLSDSRMYQPFIHGWSLYAQNLIADDTDMYDGEDGPIYKYGTLMQQILKSIGLIVDPGINYKHKSRDWALALLRDRAWVDTDVAASEVSSYQSLFGQGTAYIYGLQHIIKLREYAKRMLGSKFSLKDFHFQLLHQGPVPMDYLRQSIHKYVSCVVDDSTSGQEGCEEVLDPLKAAKFGIYKRTTN